MNKPINLHWFQKDLRVSDNPALSSAMAAGSAIGLYILDETDFRPLGGASRWWLHHSLDKLSQKLRSIGVPLILAVGKSADILEDITNHYPIAAIYFNRRYETQAKKLYARIEQCLQVPIYGFDGNLLHNPETHRTQGGKPYQVYTPFWRSIIAMGDPAPPMQSPDQQPEPEQAAQIAAKFSDKLLDWRLLPNKPDWAGGLRTTWSVGEDAAARNLTVFLENALEGYKENRNRPDMSATSRLSPHLHWGEISPRQIWQSTAAFCAANRKNHLSGDAEVFLKELCWREFSYHLLVNFPFITNRPLRPAFEKFPWRDDPQSLRLWQKGLTGYPIVDAGMRELWQTGWMHNRVRMIAASFLIKNLLIDWRIGENWFWDTLVDADAANNAASWQWVAGCGADAAPYFRIFNPVLQGEKFDPNGDYVRKYVPELSGLPNQYIHKPWTATPMELASGGVTLGKTYPHPLMDHAMARERALTALAEISGTQKPGIAPDVT